MHKRIRTPVLLAAIVFALAGCAHNRQLFDDLGVIEEAPEPEKRSFRFLERNIKGLHVTSIEEIAELPEEEVDVATGILIGSRELTPELDVNKYVAIIDRMAHELADKLGEPRTPRGVADVFSRYLYTEKGFSSFTLEEIYRPGNNNKRFVLLENLLESKKGACLNLSLLYVCLAERLGVPMSLVVIPASPGGNRSGHAFVRYADACVEFNIETTMHGRIVSEEYYNQICESSLVLWPEALNSALSRKQTIAEAFSNLGLVAVELDGNFLPKLECVTRSACLLWPDNPRLLSKLGTLLVLTGKKKEGFNAHEKARRLAPHDYYTTYKLFTGLYETGDHNSAVEVASSFLRKNPGHPANYHMQALLTHILISVDSLGKYKLDSGKELQESDGAVQEALRDPLGLFKSEDKVWLNNLSTELERRRKSLQEQEK